MPWLSNKQRAWGHSKEGEKALGGPSAVKEWDSSTGDKKLPDRVRHPGAIKRAARRIKFASNGAF